MLIYNRNNSVNGFEGFEVEFDVFIAGGVAIVVMLVYFLAMTIKSGII